MIKVPTVKVLIFLREQNEVRYTQLTKLIRSRGTLSSALKDLEEEGFIKRRIIDTKPIAAYYSLTEIGKKVADYLLEIQKTIA
ncbi:MAG: helix-turn-helix transcriptional regulator [archaeon]|nr:helix-turn-helix transcriptional regulator [archaeon]MCP8320510.1 helix-turn-helix transcriptional regulator [archaeon]